VFDKPLLPAQLYAFVAIWIAIAVFVWDLRASRAPAAT
jgi:EamA domain-containing membrane protein RarD